MHLPPGGDGVHDLLYLVGQEEDEGYQPDGQCRGHGFTRPFREGDARPVEFAAGGSGLVSGEEVCGEMAYGEGSCEHCDRGRKAASVGNAGLLEDPRDMVQRLNELLGRALAN